MPFLIKLLDPLNHSKIIVDNTNAIEERAREDIKGLFEEMYGGVGSAFLFRDLNQPWFLSGNFYWIKQNNNSYSKCNKRTCISNCKVKNISNCLKNTVCKTD